MGGRSRSNSVEETTLQVPSLDSRFAIFIDLQSCDLQAVESFTVRVNHNYLCLTFAIIVVSLLMN